jgi:2,4-dienoyl-CoA reductase-like NADH-dependent reductase (Old Yellow Enzyme family)/thioredoxin reductase
MNLASDRGEVTGRLIDHYRSLSAGGYGLVISECTFVQYKGGVSTRGLALHDDHLRPGLSLLARAVHQEGGKLGVQLFFDGAGRTFASDESKSIGPSDLSQWGGPQMRPMTEGDMERMTADFAAAATRAFEEGVDLIELHMAHGHLLGRFLSPHFNRRHDKFGGTTTGRLAFPLEVVAATRRAVGDQIPVTARLSLSEAIDGGLTLDEAITIGTRLKAAGIAAIHTSVGTGTTPEGQECIWPSSFSPEAPFAELAHQFKASTGLTTIFAGKVSSGESADELLRRGVADFISVGRAGLADPLWVGKYRRKLAPVPCIGCNQGCVDSQLARKEVSCTVNPMLGFEGLAAGARVLSTKPSVVVIGAGIAGLVSATGLARRGARVALFEASGQVGGQYRWASAAPGKQQYSRYLKYLERQAKELKVEMHVDAKTDEIQAAAHSAAHVVWAGGASPRRWEGRISLPVFNGWECFASQLLSGSEKHELVILGAGQVGCDAALWCGQLGHRVILVDRAPDPIATLGARTNAYREALMQLKVTICTQTEVIPQDDGTVVLRSFAGTQDQVVQPAAVVAAIGRTPRPKPTYLTGRAFTVGDAVRPGTAADAVRQATFHSMLWEPVRG